MTGLVLAGGLAVICFVALALVLNIPRSGWVITGAALMVGLIGYGIQGHPGEPGAPKEAAETIGGKASAVALTDGPMAGGALSSGDKMLVTAKAFARHGQFADAAETLRAAVAKDPNNGEAWLLMANSLVGHAEGNLSPAAYFAFNRAVQTAPGHPEPYLYLGLALARSGRLEEGRAVWADLLSRTAKDAPWHDDLAAELANLDAFIAKQRAAGAMQ